jgi:hypothetical protein
MACPGRSISFVYLCSLPVHQSGELEDLLVKEGLVEEVLEDKTETK